ncbi:hypothetical protein GGR57DRAFT_512936 [Xylariaceae sp. FL1272]|nr:hypothetical protein GGR57DRAFT_512936 [Xylariaceae sp. FL1272]
MEPLMVPGRDTHRDGRDASQVATQKVNHEQLFDWLDNDQLDLRLALHDYAVQLQVSSPPPDPPQSVFRRRLSLKGRSSVSSSRPATKDSFHSVHPRRSLRPLPHARRKSRNLSLLTPALTPHVSRASIDPSAAHYQDPGKKQSFPLFTYQGARSKLRAYLASPQKFDEALEFGFASREPGSLHPPEELPVADTGCSGISGTDTLKTFLEDGASSLYSVSDSESPRTPHTPDRAPHAIRPLHLSGNFATLPSKLSDGESLEPTASREMTLRMTLTRPDLRSCHDELTGWRMSSYHRYATADRCSQSLHSRSDTPDTTLSTQDATHETMVKFFADIDQELQASPGGRVKRFWHRVVRRG